MHRKPTDRVAGAGFFFSFGNGLRFVCRQRTMSIYSSVTGQSEIKARRSDKYQVGMEESPRLRLNCELSEA